jgi:hypothetical protein
LRIEAKENRLQTDTKFMLNWGISWLINASVMIETKAQAVDLGAIPETIRLQIVASAKEPPRGDDLAARDQSMMVIG